jgi:hypothetical protein
MTRVRGAAPIAETGGGALPGQIALAAMFTVSASKAALNRNDTMLCDSTVRRIDFDDTVASDTCAHMPIVKAKYMKSQ